MGLTEIVLNYNSLSIYMKDKDHKQQTAKAKIQILNLKRNMEKVRKKFLDRSRVEEGGPIKVCCVQIESIFQHPDPEVTEIKDIQSDLSGYMDFPDPFLYLFIVCDLRDAQVDSTAGALTTADSLLK